MEHDELFVKVDGFPNYVVSNFGRVVNEKYGWDLKLTEELKGFLRVTLYNKKGAKHKYVHRLVAEAFFLNYSDEVEVKHINGDTHENTVLNLTLVPKGTMREERRHRKPVRIRETNEVFESQVACARFIGGKPSYINKVLSGKRKSYLGYTYEYVDKITYG